MKLIHIISMIIIPLFSAWAAFMPVQSSQNIRNFLNGNGCIMAWSETDTGGTYTIWYGDLTATAFTPEKICDGAFPRLNADATHLLYVDLSGAICVRTCMGNSPAADRKFVTAAGRSPSWWIRPSDKTPFVLYTTGASSLWCQELDKGYRPAGPPTLLYETPVGASITYTPRSADGRFFAAREDGAGLWDISPIYATAGPVSFTYVNYTGDNSTVMDGYCHGDMNPAGDRAWQFYGSVLHFYTGAHEAFNVRKYDLTGVSFGMTPIGVPGYIDSGHVAAKIAASSKWDSDSFSIWDEIRWTSHPDFIAAGGQLAQGGRRDLFLIKPADSSMIRIGTDIETGYSVWIDTNQSVPVKSLPVASTLRGRVPLSVNFDGSKSRGSAIIYHWDFGDGAIDSSSQVSHTYAAAGTYKAWLTVGNATATDSSYMLIIADTGSVAASMLMIYPGPAITVDKGEPVSFSIRAVDANGIDLPVYNAAWSIKGASGGTISQGFYRAGKAIGVDTVTAALDSLSAQCVVTVALPALSVDACVNNFVIHVGEMLDIAISADTSRVRRVLVYYSLDNGRSMVLLTTQQRLEISGDGAMYHWLIPSMANGKTTVSDSVVIIVADYDGVEPPAFSNRFCILSDNRIKYSLTDHALSKASIRLTNSRLMLQIPPFSLIALYDIKGRLYLKRENRTADIHSYAIPLPATGLYRITMSQLGSQISNKAIIFK